MIEMAKKINFKNSESLDLVKKLLEENNMVKGELKLVYSVAYGHDLPYFK